MSIRMKLASVAAGLVLSTSLAMGPMQPTAQAAPTDNAAGFCKEILPELNGFLSYIVSLITQSEATVKLTQGACVSAIMAGNPTAAAASLCRTPQIADLIGAENLGKCQQEVKAFLQEFFGP